MVPCKIIFCKFFEKPEMFKETLLRFTLFLLNQQTRVFTGDAKNIFFTTFLYAEKAAGLLFIFFRNKTDHTYLACATCTAGQVTLTQGTTTPTSAISTATTGCLDLTVTCDGAGTDVFMQVLLIYNHLILIFLNLNLKFLVQR
jgi:hypothetical protein